MTATGLRNRLESDRPGGDERDGGSRGGASSLAAGDSGWIRIGRESSTAPTPTHDREERKWLEVEVKQTNR